MSYLNLAQGSQDRLLRKDLGLPDAYLAHHEPEDSSIVIIVAFDNIIAFDIIIVRERDSETTML